MIRGSLFDLDGVPVNTSPLHARAWQELAEALGLPPEQCLVFEDSAAGIEAAHRGGMKAIGIGTARLLPSAELTIPGFSGVMPDALLAQLL